MTQTEALTFSHPASNQCSPGPPAPISVLKPQTSKSIQSIIVPTRFYLPLGRISNPFSPLYLH